MKTIIRKLFKILGYNLGKITPFPAGAPQRPVGDMEKLLEDLKFRGLNCNAILDIGANTGGWSRMTREIYPNAKFCLIEPQLEMKEQLQSFCDSASGSIYFIVGAGEASEKKYLTVWDDLAGSSFRPFEDETLKSNGKQRMVEMITIDEIITNGKFEIPGLVKIDIQGYEIEALKGAEKLFGKTEVFILEASFYSFNDVPGMPIFSDIINFMLEKDYVIYDFGGFARRPFDGALAQCDICFVKRNGFLRVSNEWAK